MMQYIFDSFWQRRSSLGRIYSAFFSEDRFGNILVVSLLCLLEMLVFNFEHVTYS